MTRFYHQYTEKKLERIKRSVIRKRIKNIAFLSVTVLAFGISPAMSQEKTVDDLRKFYQKSCSQCHGLDGSGVSEEGKRLRGTDFTDAKWLRETEDDEMTNTILKGKFFGLAMPRFKDTLTEKEAQKMVTDIIRKCKKGQIISGNQNLPAGN